ncbi:SMP-30/gluconolactonase/LRE family protein [Mycolicibacterium sp. 050158]|uniref:SMP-30/gluconolactonase/LRE family protein n=1 Tax=Mycolicibacterium sp. 050158 TaxID=3090602 RepID=UPI00299DC02D|nr:SMP-30/gluconolactonase/LRE family protein [Mycolicibacterium sp. 050158]MDX1888668.1 SMP-30/gluconolactonase/LRE family protein [Mycolicibacterium sp. 050158]
MVELVGRGFSFTEGPRWHEGALWFSDFYTHRVLRWDGATFHTVCEVAGQPSGLGFTPAGELLVVSMIERRLLRLRAGALDVVAELADHCPGLANDMCVDAAGRAYIGNDGPLNPLKPTVLVRVDPDGAVVVAATDVVTPNGVVLSPDGKLLLLAESFAGRISAWDVRADGSLLNRRVWANFGIPRLARTLTEARKHLLMITDGITLNAAGNLWIADAAGSGVWCIAEGGNVVDHVDTGQYTAYSAVLGGDDGRSLFITAGPDLDDIHEDGRDQSVILVARVDVPAAEV